MTDLSLGVGTLGLTVNIAGSILLYKGTWALEPEPGMDIAKLAQEMSNYADMEVIKHGISGPDALEFRNKIVSDALFGPGQRNKRRRSLNSVGFCLLMVGFILQLAALWME